mmetsp:Transcript_2429/g.6430  ORF Transcript_2429/g.6430 Transcript_2429/m.6430 type:complete len:259 (-) Transcript_2429:19-795(-)
MRLLAVSHSHYFFPLMPTMALNFFLRVAFSFPSWVALSMAVTSSLLVEISPAREPKSTLAMRFTPYFSSTSRASTPPPPALALVFALGKMCSLFAAWAPMTLDAGRLEAEAGSTPPWILAEEPPLASRTASSKAEGMGALPGAREGDGEHSTRCPPCQIFFWRAFWLRMVRRSSGRGVTERPEESSSAKSSTSRARSSSDCWAKARESDETGRGREKSSSAMVEGRGGLRRMVLRVENGGLLSRTGWGDFLALLCRWG